MKKIKEDWDPQLDDMSFEDELDIYDAEQNPAYEEDNLYQYDAVGPEMFAPELFDDDGLMSEDYENDSVENDSFDTEVDDFTMMNDFEVLDEASIFNVIDKTGQRKARINSEDTNQLSNALTYMGRHPGTQMLSENLKKIEEREIAVAGRFQMIDQRGNELGYPFAGNDSGRISQALQYLTNRKGAKLISLEESKELEEYVRFRQDHLYEGYNNNTSNIAMKIADIVMEDQDDIDDDEYGYMYDEVFDLVKASLNGEEVDLTVLDKWEISSRKIDRILDILDNSTLREEKKESTWSKFKRRTDGKGFLTKLDKFIGYYLFDSDVWDDIEESMKNYMKEPGLSKEEKRDRIQQISSCFRKFDGRGPVQFNESTLREGGPRVNIDYEGIAHQFLLIKDPIKRQEACDRLFNLIAEKNAEAAAKEAAKAQKTI